MSATLHFLCGKVASGKSTLALALAAQHQAILINEDQWLQCLYPTEIVEFPDYLKYSARLRNAVAPHVESLLRQGISVVLDLPANVPRSRSWVRSIFERAGAAHVLHYVNVSEAQCLAQLSQRNLQLPAGSVYMGQAQFDVISAMFVAPTAAEGFHIQEHTWALPPS